MTPAATPPFATIIETRGLTRRFGEVLAVDRVDLHVPERCVFGFLGPNGAGKSTTIRMLLGLIKPSAGDVRLFGRPMPQERSEILRNVGSIVEAPSLYPHLTGRQNLEVMRTLLECDRRRIDAVLEVVDLAGDAHRPVRQYSMGMKQRLALASALLGEPRLLVLDEPTNGLDPAGIQKMRRMIRAFPDELGVTVFLSSHLLSEIEQTADRIGIISRGALVFSGSLDELRRNLVPRLTLRTDDDARARQVLSADDGPKVLSSPGPGLVVECPSEELAAAINRRLVTSGLAVHHLDWAPQSLEEMFMTLTADAPR